MNGRDMIREAKRMERKMGLTVTQQVKNTTTGQESLKAVATVGLPVPGAKMDGLAVGTTLVCVLGSLVTAMEAKEQWDRGGKAKKPFLARKRKQKAAGLSVLSAAFLIPLLPIPVDKTLLDKINPLNTDIVVG
tara:strand:- start:2022 stop:2420 length:399 start_codon:yes stop_codon:yes gene_type:complete